MTRIRIEGLLAAFPKLVGTGKQHTYVETENVRYVYQPIEALYLLLVTNKQSNILEDLETLRLLSKLVPEYCYTLDEEGICKTAFELIFAFDEVVCLGHKENVTVAQVKQYCEMESHEEKLHKLVLQSKINETKDIMKRKASEIDKSKIDKNRGLGMQLGKSQKTNQFLESLKAEGELIVEDVQPRAGQSRVVAPAPTDPITLTAEEKLNVTLKRDGGINAHIQVQVETGGNPGILFKTHPNMNKELFANENILGLKDPNRPFPTGSAGDAAGVGLLKWRMQSADESMVPLTINCWPSVSANETYVSIEYEASAMFDLRNVVISVPLPALREAPNVNQIDGEWRYDSRNSVLEWSIVLIDNSNRSGSMEFVVLPADSSVFFPISVRFSATSLYSDLKVANIIPLKGGGAPPSSPRERI
ncbi:Coatomer subunit delta [Hibiscus syriacus]|uniref:Coatomer subunit delta n=1 Tax=Hibiscus syriacus TaxID=106335 RepID=A0A6A2Z9A2_HIBSY|nr:Coatomer subunit delta [Hibiscus syriacus]